MSTDGDFLVETEGHCFFCLNKVQSSVPLSKPEPRKVALPLPPKLSTPSIYSLQYFSRYLKLDKTRVFSSNESITPELLAKVQRAKLKVELCEECASQTERLTKLCRQLEKIEMEMAYHIKEIHRKLVAVETDLLSRSTGPNLTSKFLGKLEIVNALRNEAAKKCTSKLDDTNVPRVKVQNLTKRQMNFGGPKMKRTCFLTPDPENSADPNYEFNVKEEPRQLPLNASPNDACDNEYYPDEAEASSWDADADSQALPSEVVDVDQKTTVVPPLSRPPNEVSAPRPIRNPETGKYKCAICAKEFSQSGDVSKHYNAVHLKIRYKCSLCSKEFMYQRNHRQHLKSEHLGIRFNCEGCGKTFATKQQLQFHLRGNKCGK